MMTDIMLVTHRYIVFYIVSNEKLPDGSVGRYLLRTTAHGLVGLAIIFTLTSLISLHAEKYIQQIMIKSEDGATFGLRLS